MPPQHQDAPPGETAAAIDRLAEAVNRQTDVALEFKPIAEFFAHAVEWQAATCRWLRRWIPRLLLGFPLIWTAVGAITPEAAKRLSALVGLVLGGH